MHNARGELPRMRLRRSWFNRGQKKGRSCYAPALLVSGASLTSRQSVAHVAQQPLVLALLLVSLPLGFLGLGLLLAGPLLLGRFLCSFTGPLLGLALRLLLFVAGYGTGGFLHLALGFVGHLRCGLLLVVWPLVPT